MATYKIPQNVEAEDKLLGPLTFKQFIYAIIAVVLGAGAFVGFGINILIGVLFIPPTLVFMLLAFYRRPDQDVEKYLVALIGFWFKPHKRVWDNDGIAEHVIIEAPKKVEVHLNDDRTRSQVKSQLKELAKVVDTRGWSTKHANLDGAANTDDRLVGFEELRYASSTASTVPDADEATAADDIMDESANVVAQKLDQQSQQTVLDARKHAIATMRKAAMSAPPSNPPTN